MKYRKKELIEAVQFFDDTKTLCELSELMEEVRVNYEDKKNPKLLIKTPEGIIRASIGDFIIKHKSGLVYPCKPDTFEKTYVLIY